MKRREFFRLGANKIAKAATQQLADTAARRAKRWFRPPYAKAELDFLLACDRCGKCIDACSFGVLFPLPARLGFDVAQTPAMDLVNKGCQLCDDWPCVTACAPNALIIEDDNLPVLAKAHIDQRECLPYNGPECGACQQTCPLPDTLIFDGIKPKINQDSCIGCGLCREVCIAQPKAIFVERYEPTVEPADS